MDGPNSTRLHNTSAAILVDQLMMYDASDEVPKILLEVKRRHRCLTGPTEIRTQVSGFKVQRVNHYTMGPFLSIT